MFFLYVPKVDADAGRAAFNGSYIFSLELKVNKKLFDGEGNLKQLQSGSVACRLNKGMIVLSITEKLHMSLKFRTVIQNLTQKTT